MRELSLIIISLIIITFSCKEESCPEREDIGIVQLSPENRTYLPDNYLSEIDTIEFESIDGRVSKFYNDRISNSEHGPLSIKIYCEEDPSQEIRISYNYEENSYRYKSDDSLKLILINKVGTIEEGYYDVLNIWLSKELGNEEEAIYGQVNIITNKRLVADESLINNSISFTYYDLKEIARREYEEVYGVKNPEITNSDVYWKQDKGMIGYKDKEGVEWVLKE